MSKWIDRILGLQDEENFEKEFEMDFGEEYKNQQRKGVSQWQRLELILAQHSLASRTMTRRMTGLKC